MKRRSVRLGRHILRAMVLVTVSSVLVAVFGMYVFYGIMIRHAPHLLQRQGSWLPGALEWTAIIVLCLAATLLALPVAIGLTRRIVGPLVSVAESARRIADGDTAARAQASDRSMAEAAMLVDDFNQMATRLERASEAVIRWNATIAHELRTPVTILSGRLQGLADGVFQPDPQMLCSLQAQVDALARLVEDLRTVSLFEGGRLDVRVERVALADDVAAVVRLMQPRLEAAGFQLESRLDTGLCDVDRGRMRQALIALLENVRRHADPGPVRVALGLSSGGVMLSVTDSGPGLPADFAPYAFDPFRQMMDSDEPAKGMGLGLAVVRAIAEAHGGTASYVTVDGGARFVIAVPRRQLAD